MKKYLLLLLLIVPLVAGADLEQIYSGKTKASSITAEGKTFGIYAVSESYARITFPSGRTELMQAGDCASDFYRVCIITINESTDDKDYDIESQTYPIYVQLIIHSPGEVVDFTRTFEKTTMLVGEAIDVDVDITNSGSLPVDEVIYSETVLESFDVFDLEGCQRIGTRVEWTGPMTINGKHECSYTLRPSRNLTHESEAKLAYWEESITRKQTLTVQPPPLRITYNISKQELDILEQAVLDVFIVNTHKDYAINNIDVAITFPQGFDVTKVQGKADQEGDAYKMRGTLGVEENHSLRFIITPKKVGNSSIGIRSRYVLSNDFTRAFTMENSLPLTVSTEQLALVLGDVVEQGDRLILPVRIVNGNPKLAYKNLRIEGVGDVDFDQGVIFVDELRPGQSHEVELSAKVPMEYGEYEIGARTDYTSPQGEGFVAREAQYLEIGVPEQAMPGGPPTTGEEPATVPDPQEEGEGAEEPDQPLSLDGIFGDNTMLWVGGGLGGLLVLVLIIAVVRLKRG